MQINLSALPNYERSKKVRVRDEVIKQDFVGHRGKFQGKFQIPRPPSGREIYDEAKVSSDSNAKLVNTQFFSVPRRPSQSHFQRLFYSLQRPQTRGVKINDQRVSLHFAIPNRFHFDAKPYDLSLRYSRHGSLLALLILDERPYSAIEVFP